MKLQSEAAPEILRQISAEISARLEHRTRNAALLAAPTAHLGLEPYLKLLWFLGAYGRDASGKPQKIMGLQQVDVATSLVSAAAGGLENWPQGFRRLLDRISGRSAGQAIGNKLATQFGYLYPTLYKTFAGDEFAFLRRAFEDYLYENWSGQLAARNRRLSRDLKNNHEWVPIAKAARLLRVRAPSVRSLIARGVLKGSSYRTATGRSIGVVHRHDLDRFSKEQQDWLTLKQVRELLGISRKRADALIAAGELVSIVSERKTGTPWVFRRSQVLQSHLLPVIE